MNNVYHKLNMFMIHPAFAGSEVYVKLADQLSDDYSCYGIDNYNLHHPKKIKDIMSLAGFYLDLINATREQTNQENEPYVLLGWSLGGRIALNIAYILEKAGYSNIYVILIDAVYPDKNFSNKLSQVVLDNSKLKLFAQQAGLDPEYATKVRDNFEYDIKLSFEVDKQIKLKHLKFPKKFGH